MINLPIFAIFSFLTVPLIHFALLTGICSPYLSSNLPKLVDLYLFAAPTIWNSLPLALRTSFSSTSFHSALKTHLFPPLDLPLPLSVCWILTRHRVCLSSG